MYQLRFASPSSEFLMQGKKSFVCFAYSPAFFWFLSLLFCFSSCRCFLLCVFVCYYVYHAIRFAFLAFICGLSPWCSSSDRIVWLFVPYVLNLCSCLCDFNVVYLFSSDVIILLWYLCFGFRLHACICLFWCDHSCLVFVFWLFLMEHVIRYLSSSIAVACGHAFVSNECPMTSQRSNNLLVIMGSAVQNVFSHCHCSQPRKIRSSCTVWGARQGTDLCSHGCF